MESLGDVAEASTSSPINVGDFRLRQRIIELEGLIKNQEQHLAGLAESEQVFQVELSNAKSDNYRLQDEIEKLESQLAVAEARVADLKETIQVERNRFDNLLGHAHEVEKGIRARIGLVAKEAGEGSSQKDLQPIANRRKPWPVQQAELETASKQKYWEGRVKEVEEADKKKAANDSNGSPTQATEG